MPPTWPTSLLGGQVFSIAAGFGAGLRCLKGTPFPTSTIHGQEAMRLNTEVPMTADTPPEHS